MVPLNLDALDFLTGQCRTALDPPDGVSEHDPDNYSPSFGPTVMEQETSVRAGRPVLAGGRQTLSSSMLASLNVSQPVAQLPELAVWRPFRGSGRAMAATPSRECA